MLLKRVYDEVQVDAATQEQLAPSQKALLATTSREEKEFIKSGMVAAVDGATHIRNSDGAPIRVSHVQVLRAPARQKITPRFIEQQMADGILSMGDGKITLRTGEGEPDLVYRILSGPGLYCCHCGGKLGDQVAARAHVQARHPGGKSPDKNHPAGYRRDNFYTCEREG